MDKNELNNQIVLGRVHVRAARVHIIRALTRQLQKLKNCKGGAQKEKRQRKSERVLEALQILKKLKADAILKFALIRQKNELDEVVKANPSNNKNHCFALVGKHKFVQTCVSTIHGKCSNWQKEIPELIKAIGKPNKCKGAKPKVKAAVQVNKISPETCSKTIENCNNTGKSKKKLKEDKNDAKQEKKSEKKLRKVNIEEAQVSSESKEKVVDPFFINKVITLPKLLAMSTHEDSPLSSKDEIGMGTEKSRSKPKVSNNTYKTKTHKAALDSQLLEKQCQLHPSWAAKKQKLIVPFQGKKITF